MTAILSALGAFVVLVLAFPFAFGMRNPCHFDAVEELYSRVIFGTGAVILFATMGFDIGGDMMKSLLIDRGMVSPDEAASAEILPPKARLGLLVSLVLAFLYLVALTAFKFSVARPLCKESERNGPNGQP